VVTQNECLFFNVDKSCTNINVNTLLVMGFNDAKFSGDYKALIVYVVVYPITT
jgi:hypothetical protein